MTDHKHLLMHQERRRISDKELLVAILSMGTYCTISLHDEPYPYIVPMNYGFKWEESLVFYLHMAVEGHRLELIKKNPLVGINVSIYIDRVGKKKYRDESHDYRSVTAFGKAEIIDPRINQEEFIHGLSVLNTHNERPPIKKISSVMLNQLYILKITADYISGKAQYPISTMNEVKMPNPED